MLNFAWSLRAKQSAFNVNAIILTEIVGNNKNDHVGEKQ